MSFRPADIPFSDSTGSGRVFVTRRHDTDRVRVEIDKMPRGNALAGVTAFVTLDDRGATVLRDALDRWLRRNDPEPETAL